MNKEIMLRMSNQFDALVRTHPDAQSVEFRFARDLQEPLGYARWENFLTAITRAIESCRTTGFDAADHFRGVTKMVELGSGTGVVKESLITADNPTGRIHFVASRNGSPRINHPTTPDRVHHVRFTSR
jgi:DNA-damage-inducible protein D